MQGHTHALNSVPPTTAAPQCTHHGNKGGQDDVRSAGRLYHAVDPQHVPVGVLQRLRLGHTVVGHQRQREGGQVRAVGVQDRLGRAGGLGTQQLPGKGVGGWVGGWADRLAGVAAQSGHNRCGEARAARRATAGVRRGKSPSTQIRTTARSMRTTGMKHAHSTLTARTQRRGTTPQLRTLQYRAAREVRASPHAIACSAHHEHDEQPRTEPRRLRRRCSGRDSMAVPTAPSSTPEPATAGRTHAIPPSHKGRTSAPCSQQHKRLRTRTPQPVQRPRTTLARRPRPAAHPPIPFHPPPSCRPQWSHRPQARPEQQRWRPAPRGRPVPLESLRQAQTRRRRRPATVSSQPQPQPQPGRRRPRRRR